MKQSKSKKSRDVTAFLNLRLSRDDNMEGESYSMSEEKKGDLDRVTLKSDTLKKYFPKSWTPQKMEEQIIKLLDKWAKQRQQPER